MTIKTVPINLALTFFLSGCWQIPMKGESPAQDDYLESKRNIESFYGSTREDMVKRFGDPVWTGNIGESTYFIYEWQSSTASNLFGMFIFIPFPVPVPLGAERSKTEWYCLLLEFDDERRLIHHEAAVDTSNSSFDHSSPCRVLFGLNGRNPYPRSFSGCHGTWSEIEECAKEKYERKPTVR